jgi:hypothetical protein
MSWITSGGLPTVAVGSNDDWLDDDDDHKKSTFDPIESLRLKFTTLGENEGLDEGMKTGEVKGYEHGYSLESVKAFYLGRIIGCCKVVLQTTKSIAMKAELIRNFSELEQVAKEHWVNNPTLVDEHMNRVRLELARLGVNIPEWKDGEEQ